MIGACGMVAARRRVRAGLLMLSRWPSSSVSSTSITLQRAGARAAVSTVMRAVQAVAVAVAVAVVLALVQAGRWLRQGVHAGLLPLRMFGSASSTSSTLLSAVVRALVSMVMRVVLGVAVALVLGLVHAGWWLRAGLCVQAC